MTASQSMDAETAVAPEAALPHMAVIYRYGLLAPEDWGDDCEEEIRLQRGLWNRLVEIDQADRAAYRKVVAGDPAVAGLEQEVTRLCDKRKAALQTRRGLRKAARVKVKTPALDDLIKQVNADLKPLLEQLRTARGVAKAAHQEEVESLKAAHFEAVKLARQQSGCYWANYNAVCAAYRTARSAAMKSGTELRPKGHRDEARLTVQLQGGLRPAELFAATRSQVGVLPLGPLAWTGSTHGERRRHQYSVLTMTVHRRDGSNRTARWPLYMHRPIPEDALIQEVVVTRRRVASHFKWQVCFLCRVAAPAASTARHSLALDLGWRMMGDGLRVGTVLSTASPAPTHITLPSRWLHRMHRIEEIRHERDEAFAVIVAMVRSLKWDTAPTALRDLATRILAAPRCGFGLVARLALEWRTYQNWQPAAYKEIEQWRRDDKLIWDGQEHGRRQLAAWRRDIFRCAAKNLLADCGTLIVEDISIADMAVKERPNGTETSQHASQRHNRTLAAPGELRDAFLNVARREGLTVIRHHGRSTRHCFNCDRPVELAQPELLRQQCPHCRAHWDQDENACRVMLRTHTAFQDRLAAD